MRSFFIVILVLAISHGTCGCVVGAGFGGSSSSSNSNSNSNSYYISGGNDRLSLACDILYHPKSDYLVNNGDLNALGSGDGASAYANLWDTCAGSKAKRSSYCCSSGCAPGGSVYLSTRVLSYIRDLLDDGYYLKINSLAGACHSSRSWHYQGTAVDFQVYSTSPYSVWMSRCSAAGARENLGPSNHAGHQGHTHCAFDS